MVTECLQMADSLMPVGTLSELCGYGVPPNDHLLDASGNTQRALSLQSAYAYGVPPNHRLLHANGSAQRAL